MVAQPVVAVPAARLVNASGKVQNYPGMGACNVKPGGSCPIPKKGSHLEYLRHHGFELA